MKIEIDTINGMEVVAEFSAETEIVKGSLKLKAFLKEDFEGTLGFEVTEEEAQAIFDQGYGIKGFGLKMKNSLSTSNDRPNDPA